MMAAADKMADKSRGLSLKDLGYTSCGLVRTHVLYLPAHDPAAAQVHAAHARMRVSHSVAVAAQCFRNLAPADTPDAPDATLF